VVGNRRIVTVSVIRYAIGDSGKTIHLYFQYHNQGNTYSTIVYEHLMFNNKGESLKKQGLVFWKLIPTEEKYKSTILTPGELSIRHLLTPTDFSDRKGKLDHRKPIDVRLVIRYINDSGTISYKVIPLGTLRVNEDGQIDNFSIEYKQYRLDKGRKLYSESYHTRN
jgi:hypothetical protein